MPQRRALIGKIRLFNYFFQFQVAIEYSQYAFLRSLHIQHNFTIRATVPQGSPAFDLIDGITFNMGFYSTAQPLRQNLQSCLQGLQHLFMEGRAWPTDIEDRIVKSLLDLGVDVLDIMPLQTFGPSILPIIGHEAFDEQGTMDQEELPRALLEKWETQVCDILTRNDAKSHILARGKVGETPLHIATCWPRGVELLLQLGGDTVTGIIDAEDDNGSTALDYALKLNEPECVNILLESSAAMDLEVIQNIAKWEMTSGQMAVTPILAQALVRRRKQLLCLANEHIQGSKYPDDLSPNGEVLIQEDAFELVQELSEKGISLPKEFRNVQPGSVYHCAYMNDETAESLFGAGFSHTNVKLLGFTPLMTTDLVGLSHRYETKIMYSHSALGLVDWFLNHGEDLSTPIPADAVGPSTDSRGDICHGACLVHRIASEMGRSMRYQTAFGSDRHTPVLQRVLTSTVLDSCECLCTQNGCSAASILSREVWRLANGTTTPGELSGFDRTTWRIVVDLLTSRLSDHLGARQFASDFIRVSTFERLGMSHTCCRFVENSGKYEDRDNGVTFAILNGDYKLIEVMDREDVSEIQEEERYLAELLEVLMEEFEAKYEELGWPLGDFFLTYWWTRMGEVDAGNNVSGEELEALRTTGVIVHV
ncbi:hypothetical protein SLS63_008231 [Diaporthe eres]|uniref:Ankyrin n=1 Tax=Diaporthe eres TaxID=83184 RepID=A0ABR1P2Z2_DIAER